MRNIRHKDEKNKFDIMRFPRIGMDFQMMATYSLPKAIISRISWNFLSDIKYHLREELSSYGFNKIVNGASNLMWTRTIN